ncbi:MAG: hypothetical protein MUP82_10325 [Candidatus Marinimicrobia bacterium]|nr:hypothetical protein [Candidatus Neomarinimicrobiota bacterium]
MYDSQKQFRSDRLQNFKEKWLPILLREVEVSERENGSYTFELPEFGIIDFFPKANNLLIRKNNEWKKPGLEWLIKNVIDKM